MAIETQNGDYNLYASAATIYNKTATADHDLSLEIRFGDGSKNMSAGVGTITFIITNDGGTQEEVFYKGTQTRPIVPISKLHVANGKTLTITAQSSNSNDTDVNVTVTPRWEVVADSSGKIDLTAASQTLLVAAIEAEIADDATGEAVKQAIINKLLENLPELDDLSLAAIADAVWDELLADHAAVGSLGKALADILIDTDSTLPAAIVAAAFNPATAQADTGVSWNTAMAWMLAATSGPTAVNLETGAVAFYLNDGVTVAFTNTYGSVIGHRTARTPG